MFYLSIKDSVLLASLLTNMQCEMVERHVRALNRITTNFKDGVVSSHTFYTTLYIVHQSISYCMCKNLNYILKLHRSIAIILL